MRTGRRLRRCIIGGSVILLVATGLWAIWPRERLLLNIAMRVTPTSDFEHWVSDHEFLSVNYPSIDNSLKLPQVVRHDIATRGIRSSSIRHVPDTDHAYTEISPDGRWALSSDSAQKDPGKRVVAEDLATGRYASWPASGNTYHYPTLWLADSRRWLQVSLIGQGYVMLHSVDAPTNSVQLAFPDYKTIKYPRFVLTKPNHLLTCDELTDDNSSDDTITGFDIREYWLLPQIVQLRKLHVECPNGGKVDDMSISPAGDRIVWACSETRPSQFADLIQRWFPYFHATPHHLLSVWVTRLDGSDKHEIGYMPFPERKEDEEEQPFTHLAWLPDDKRISFVYRGNLYTAPSE